MVRTLAGRMAVLLAAGSLSAWAQGTQTASVAGRVIDAEDAAIAGAGVRLTSPSLQGVWIAATDSKGRFAARFLPPGAYLIEITKADYQTIKLNQRLGLDQNFQPRFRMARNQHAVVEIVAAPPGLDKTDAKTASNYRMDRIDMLPVARTMESIALLTPGVVEGVGGGVQVRGAMTTNNRILVDGQNVEDGVYGDRGVSLIEDAIEETQVLTGALSAEYGNVDGGVINSITRSGSNTLSGQVRWDFRNPAWNAMGPMIDRSASDDHTGIDTTFSLGGYLIKDRLWFHTAYFKEGMRELRTLSGEALSDALDGNAGAGYTYSRDEIRRQLKLTWLVSEEQTLVASYMNSGAVHDRRDYLAGSLDTLVPQRGEDELLNIAWRAVWSPQLISDIRYGYKKAFFSVGTPGNATDLRSSPVYYNGLFYQHGPFNGSDGGDQRDNQTLTAKTSCFFDAMGSHQMDFGFDWGKSSRRARSEISATGYIFAVAVDPVDRSIIPNSVWVYESRGGAATVENHGLYCNDKWVPNEHLAGQLGLRWDQYTARDEAGAKFAGAGSFSPRLGLKYDFLGDSKWIAGASYARYNGKILDQILMGATHQGNAQEVDFLAAALPPGPYTWNDVFNLANYDFSAASVAYASIPGVNIQLNPALKPPSVDEYQASLAYTFSSAAIGTGYLRTTAVYKNWKNLIDYRVGNKGQIDYLIHPPNGQDFLYPTYIKYWDNNRDATRTYKALELEFSTAKRCWQFLGSLTWSRLWGNYEGQDNTEPGRGEGINSWNLDRNLTAPEGYLRGHVPFRARLMGTYTLDSRLGKTTLGLLYRFDSGSYVSETRIVSGSALNVSLPTEAQNAVFTQYKDSRRGTLVGASSSYLDVSVNHDWELRKVKAVAVRAFVRAVVKNLFNHQQILRRPKVYAAYPAAYTDPWVPENPDTFGQPNGACFGEPRTYSISAGVRF